MGLICHFCSSYVTLHRILFFFGALKILEGVHHRLFLGKKEFCHISLKEIFLSFLTFLKEIFFVIFNLFLFQWLEQATRSTRILHTQYQPPYTTSRYLYYLTSGHSRCVGRMWDVRVSTAAAAPLRTMFTESSLFNHNCLKWSKSSNY